MTATLLTVFVLQWLILLTPGPNVLLVTVLAASGQRRAAFAAGVGISAVAVLWALAAMQGVQALFAALPGLRLTVQILGGLYLCRMAWRMWGAWGGTGTPAAVDRPAGVWGGLRAGVTTNVLNPKSALFYSSVFAAAMPMQASWTQQMVVLVLVWVNAMVWHLLLAGLLSHPRAQAVYSRHERGLNRVAAACFGLFGARLLAQGVQGAQQDWVTR